MIDPRETVVSIARELGVNPWQALSVWQQESGGSTDTNLLGKPLSRNRGNAVGPWQVVPAYHPNFPVGGSFEDQTRYALGYLKDVGPAGYYGTGKPPPGDPTSDQYVAQVNARAAQLAQAGRPDIQQGLFAEAKPMAGQQAPQPMAPQQQMMPPMGMQPPGFWDKLSGSPAFNMGLGILASNTGNYGAAGPAIGRGALMGMQNAGSLQEGRAEQMYKQMQMQQAQMKYQKDLQDAAKVDAWVATLPPDEQQLAGIIGADKLAQFKMEQQKGVPQTEDEREFDRAQRDPAFAAYMERMKQAGASSVNVSVGGDKAEEKALAELGVKQYEAAQSALENTQPKLGAMEVMGQLLDEINTGKLQPAITDIKGWADSLGFNIPGIEKLAPSQAFNALANQMTLQARSTANGTGMPGAMSDADREFLRQMVPGLEKQKGTNRVLLDVMRRMTVREQEIATIKMKYFDKYGTMRPTTDPTTGERVSVAEAVRRFIEARPVFSEDYVKQVLGGM